MFISPLLNKDSIDKELNAVNSEYSMNLRSDIRRNLRILQVLAKDDNPFNKFSTGNFETLRDIPQKNGIDTYNELVKFHSKWYSANIMKLVILHNLPLNKLEKLVENTFKYIKNSNVILKKNNINPYEKLPIQVHITPISDNNKLELHIQIDSNNLKYFRSNLIFVKKLLKCTGKNSLSHLLKKKNYILNNIRFGYLTLNNNWSYYIFSIFIDLTKLGLDNFDKVINYVIQYMNYFKNLDQTFLKKKFKSLNDIMALNFMFKKKENPINYVQYLSINMARYDKKYYLVGDQLMRKFNKNIFEYILDTISKQKFIVILMSKKYNNNNKLIEHYYGIKYSIHKYTKINVIDDTSIFKISDKNKYVPTDLTIKKIQSPHSKYPQNIKKSDGFEIWFKQDYKFKKPFVYHR